MKRIMIIVLVIALMLACSNLVFGATPVGFGAKAAAMGGAFTAVADDGSAVYWNPAGIYQFGFTLTPGAGIYGSYDSNYDYNSFKESTTFPPPIPDGNIGLPFFAGITTKYTGANLFVDLGTFAVDDQQYTKIYADGSAYGTITGAAGFGNLMVGASYKIVRGATATYNMIKVNMDPIYLRDNPTEALKLLDPDNNTSIVATGDGYAIDIGILYKMSNQLKLGFTTRNLMSSVNWSGDKSNYTLDPVGLTSPTPEVIFIETKSSYSATTSLPRTYVVGLAYSPYKSAILAVDVELITSDDSVLNQTRLHFGFEQTALWKTVALRLGAYTDKNEASLGLTAGLGLKLGPVLVDLAAVKAGDSSLGFFATAGFKF